MLASCVQARLFLFPLGAAEPRKVASLMISVVDPDSPSLPSDPCEQAVQSLLEALGKVPDSRKARGVRYPLDSTLGLCVVAFICGRQNLTQVMRFGRDHPELLLDLGFPRKRSPSVPTLSRLLGATKAADLQAAVGDWFVTLVGSQRKRARCTTAAVDGKTSCSAGIHVLNVFLHDVHQVVWQMPVGEKKNEISALKEGLSEIFETYPFLRILTGDALFAGAPLCSQIIERGRHYLFQVKGDQPHLFEKLDLVFAAKLSRAVREGAFTGEKKRLRHRA